MRILIATFGNAAYHEEQRAVFTDLARLNGEHRHQLETEPNRADALLFIDLQQHPDDPLLARVWDDDLVQRFPEKIFVYDERDRPFYTFPGVYPSATRQLGRFRPVLGGPYSRIHTPMTLTQQEREPNLLFSFAGSRTHPVRDDILSLAHPRGVVVDTSGMNFFDTTGAEDPAVEAARRSYVSLVNRSKFVLCPRGHGASAFRIYETLAAGRIPVIISDDWLPPRGVDWSAGAVRIRERDARRVGAILERVEADWRGRDSSQLARAFAPPLLWDWFGDALMTLRKMRRPQPLGWAEPTLLIERARRARHRLLATPGG